MQSKLSSPIVRSARAALLAVAALSLLAARGAAQGGTLPGTIADPENRPPLSLFVDSAALARAVAALPAPALPEGVPPLFIVSFDSTGVVDELSPMFDQIPAGYAGAVVAAIRAHLKPQAPSPDPITTYLRVVAGPEPVVDRPPVVERAPRLVNRDQVRGLLSRLMESSGAGEGWGYEAELRFRILPDGTVDTTSTQIVRAGGEPRLDREATAIVHAMRFSPPTVAGLPVRSWAVQPIGIQGPEEGPPVEAVVDQAALARAVAGLPVPALPQGVRPIFWVTFDTAGAVAQVEPVFAQIPASYAEAVAAAIRAHARPQGRLGGSRRTHLRVEGGGRPVVDRPVIIDLRPMPDSRAVLRWGAETVRSVLGIESADGPLGTAVVRLRVLADGKVDPESVEIVSYSGREELRGKVVPFVRGMRFRPAQVDSVPVTAWTRETIAFHPMSALRNPK